MIVFGANINKINLNILNLAWKYTKARLELQMRSASQKKENQFAFLVNFGLLVAEKDRTDGSPEVAGQRQIPCVFELPIVSLVARSDYSLEC